MSQSSVDVVGPGEIADMFDVHPVTVSKWQREGVLPLPDAELKRVSVWDRQRILDWAEETGRTVHD